MGQLSTFDFEIPPLTKQSAPIYLQVELPQRIVESIQVQIPKGHKKLAHLRIATPSRVLIPSTGSSVQWVQGDDMELSVSPGVVIEGPPYRVVFWGYNEDSRFVHAFIINIITR